MILTRQGAEKRDIREEGIVSLTNSPYPSEEGVHQLITST